MATPSNNPNVIDISLLFSASGTDNYSGAVREVTDALNVFNGVMKDTNSSMQAFDQLHKSINKTVKDNANLLHNIQTKMGGADSYSKMVRAQHDALFQQAGGVNATAEKLILANKRAATPAFQSRKYAEDLYYKEMKDYFNGLGQAEKTKYMKDYYDYRRNLFRRTQLKVEELEISLLKNPANESFAESFKYGLRTFESRGRYMSGFGGFLSRFIGNKMKGGKFGDVMQTAEGGNPIKGTGVNLGLVAIPLIAAFSKVVSSATSALGDFAKGLMDSYGVMEAAKVRLGVIYGNGAEAENAFSEIANYAIKSPFSVQSTVEFATLLKQSGVYSKDLMSTLKMIGDVTGGNEEKMKRVANNYAQVVAQTRATSRDLREFAMAGIPIYKELAKTLGISVAEVKNLGTQGKISGDVIQKTFKNMTTNGGIFEGAIEKGSKTYMARSINFEDLRQLLRSEIAERYISSIANSLLDIKTNIYSIWYEGVKVRNDEKESKKAKKEAGGKEIKRKATAKIGDRFTTGGIQTPESYELARSFFSFDKNYYDKRKAEATKFYEDMEKKFSKVDFEAERKLLDAVGTPLRMTERSANGVSYETQYGQISDFFEGWHTINQVMSEVGSAGQIAGYNTKMILDLIFSLGTAAMQADASHNVGVSTMEYHRELTEKKQAKWEKKHQEEIDFYFNTQFDVARRSAEEFFDEINKGFKELEYGTKEKLTAKGMYEDLDNEYKKTKAYREAQEKEYKDYLDRARATYQEQKDLGLENSYSFLKINPKVRKEVGDDIDKAFEYLDKFYTTGDILGDYKSSYDFSKLLREMDKDQLHQIFENFGNLQSFFTEDLSKYLPIIKRKDGKIVTKDDDIIKGFGKLFSEIRGKINAKGLTDEERELWKKQEKLLDYILNAPTLSAPKYEWTEEIEEELIEPFFSFAERFVMSRMGFTEKEILANRQGMTNNLSYFANIFKDVRLPQQMIQSLATAMMTDIGKVLDKNVQSFGLQAGTKKLGVNNIQDFLVYNENKLNWKDTAKNMEKFALSLESSVEYTDAYIKALQEETNKLSSIIVSGIVSTEDVEQITDKLYKQYKEGDIKTLEEIATTAGFKIDLTDEVGTKDAIVSAIKTNGKNVIDIIKPWYEQDVKKLSLAQQAKNIKEFITQVNTAVAKPQTISSELLGLSRSYNFMVGKEAGNNTKSLFDVKPVNDAAWQDSLMSLVGKEGERYSDVFATNDKTGLAKALFGGDIEGILQPTDTDKITSSIEKAASDIVGAINGDKAKKSSENSEENEDSSSQTEKKLTKWDSTYDKIRKEKEASLMRLNIEELGKTRNYNDKRLELNADIDQTKHYLSFGPEGVDPDKEARVENLMQERDALDNRYETEMKILDAKRQQTEAMLTKDSLEKETADTLMNQLNTDMKIKAVEAENVKNMAKLTQTFVSAVDNAWSKGLTSSFEQIGKSIVKISRGLETWEEAGKNLADVWADVAQEMLSSIGTGLIQAGIQFIANNPTWAGLGVGAALIAAGGAASLLSGVFSAEDETEDKEDSEKERLQTLKDLLSDIIDQAKVDADYYQKNYLHKRALQENEALSVQDAVITPRGDVIRTSPEDYIFATKTPGNLVSKSSSNVNIQIVNQSGDKVSVARAEKTVDKDGNVDIKAIIVATTADAIANGEMDGAFSALSARHNGRSVAW